MPELHEVETRENKGRDTIDRYRLQFIAAAYASLEILKGQEVDRVFCDYHDDFVVRVRRNDSYVYRFFQVKTKDKRNHLWSLPESFGIKKKTKSLTPDDLKQIKDSFFGKLLLHAINFKSKCDESSLLTNVQFEDTVEKLIESLQNGSENLTAELLIQHFRTIFSLPNITEETSKTHLGKLRILPGKTYLSPNSEEFASVARDSIYKYSEIDLTQLEIAEIAQSLIALAHNKSFKKILFEVSEKELDEKAGIGLGDLLGVLSISNTAYSTLLNGGDEKALKSASIIARRLRKAGAAENMIEYCSKQKVEWDIWIRNQRHSIDELQFNLLQQDITQLANKWNGADWDWLNSQLEELCAKKQKLSSNINTGLLMGGLFAALIKGNLL